MPDCGNVLVKVAVILGVLNRVPAAIPEHNVFCYSTVAHILTPSVNLVFGPKSGFKNKCRVKPGSGLLFRVPAGFRLKNEALLRLFVCVYACRGQQGEIEWMHPPPTNSKYRLKLFFEINYANFRPNVFGAGKSISMEILVGVRLHG